MRLFCYLFCGALFSVRSSSSIVDPNPHFADMWNEDLTEVEAEEMVVTSGKIPSFLSGTLVRNGPAQFQSLHRNFTWAFDGLAKLCSWSFERRGPNANYTIPIFRSAFIRSKTFNKTRKDKKFPKMMTVGDVVPKYGLRDGIMPLHDNVNVNVWKFTDDATNAMTLTDSVDSVNFDPVSLSTKGIQDWSNDTLKKTEISCGHPHIEPNTNGTSLINYALAVNPMGNVTINMYKMGKDHIRKPFGIYKNGVTFTPYIHSFSVTNRYVILLVYPTAYNMMCMIMGKPMHECMEWKGRTVKTQVVVFDLFSQDPDAEPVFVSEVEAFHSQHHINAYEVETKKGKVQIVLDLCAYASPKFWTSKYPFGEFTVMTNQTARNQVGGFGTLRRLKITFSTATEAVTNAKGSVQVIDIPVKDKLGNIYTVDFPFINRGAGHGGLDGKHYCTFFALSPRARNSTEWADWAIVQVNMCHSKNGVNAKVWFEPQQYPGEPIFVPEDIHTLNENGVLLINVLDGIKETSYLQILNATTLTSVARIDHRTKHSLPYMQHAAFFTNDRAFLETRGK